MTVRQPHQAFPSVQRPQDFHVDWPGYYADALAKTRQVQGDVHAEVDLAYGPHQRHTVDLYLPARRGGSTPVVVFLHGGAFREGHPAYYGHLARGYVDRGIAVAMAGYRLLPECPFPDSAADVIRLLEWLRGALPARGLALDRLFLAGHSAGAMLTARLSLRCDWQAAAGLPDDVIKGAVMISGIYDLRGGERASMILPGTERDASAVCNVQACPPYVLVGFGVPEKNRIANSPLQYARHGLSLAELLGDRGTRLDVVALPDTDHIGTAGSFGDEHGRVFARTVDALLGPDAAARERDRGGPRTSLGPASLDRRVRQTGETASTS